MAITISGTGITSSQIEADGIDSIKDCRLDAITSEHLVAGGVDNEHLATGIDAAKLTGTVADARISTLTASKLTGAIPAISGANFNRPYFFIFWINRYNSINFRS